MNEKRLLAFLLALCLAFTPALSSLNVHAAEVGSETTTVLSVSPGDADSTIFNDFEAETGNWGFSGDLAGNISVATKSESDNYLLFARSKEATGEKLATKAFADMPEMTSAKVSFEWSTISLTSTSQAGFLGVSLLSGDREILTLYYDELRGVGDSKNKGNIWYSTNDGAMVDTGVNVDYGSAHDVVVDLDFTTHTMDVSMDGSSLLTDVAFSEIVSKVDALSMGQYGTVKISNVNMGIDDFVLSWEEFTGLGEEYTISDDFENVTDNWGFTGDLSGNISATAKSDSGKYLLLSRSKESTGEKIATKTFADVPDMATAKVSFEWSTISLTSASQAGFLGISLQSGGKEIITLYYDELRGVGDSKNKGNIWYSVKDGELVDTGVNVDYGSVHDVVVDLDFANHTLDVTMDGTSLVSDIVFTEIITKMDSLVLGQYGTVKISNVNMGIDDFTFTYVEQLSTGEKEVYIYELAPIADVTLTKEAYEAAGSVIAHPQTVSATLSDGSTADVSIDQSSWTCSPTFDANVKGVYTWTADIVAPEGSTNSNNLTASYRLLYKVATTSTHDYENDFTFDEDVSGFKKWSKSYAGNDGSFALTIASDESVTGYMHATVSGDGDRGSVLDVPGYTEKIVKGTAVEFDWKPMDCNENATGGQILFVAPGQYHSYFTLRFDGNYNLSYYTETPVSNATSQKSFDGIIKEADAVFTGLGGQNKWFTVKVDFDYAEHTADLTITEKGNEANTFTKTDIPIETEANGLKTFLVHMDRSGKGASVTMGLDNLMIDYAELGATDIQSVGSLADVKVSKDEWATYKHPETIEVTMADGSKTNVSLGEWTAEPEFDEDVEGIYTWTAPLVTGELSNMFGLTATYKMSYVLSTESEHDYENYFDISNDISGFEAWSKSMDSSSGTGAFSVSVLLDEANNGYLNAKVSGGGDRGSRVDINNAIVKGAEISFDWMPVAINETANGQLMFLAPDSWHPYFILRADTNNKLYYFTENPLAACATQQEAFEGSISAANAVDTGLSGANKWFEVNIKFDYVAHTADLTITEKENTENTFTKTAIPLEKEANGLKSFVIHMNKLSGTGSVEMNIDSIVVDYEECAATDIISIQQPEDVKVAKSLYDKYEYPTYVVATLGDLSTVDIPLGTWTSSPEFNMDVEDVYTWTAPLEAGEYNNLFSLEAEYDMDYTLLPFPLYVHNPNTVELEFGEAMPTEFPTEVVAFMSDGSTGTMAVGEWTAIREFDAEKEGIYVYGANLVATDGRDQIVREQLNRNENHDDHGSDKDKYVYDVYYRISYFETEDNYNAYTRSMEYLDRGVYAVPADNGIFVSWRLLVTEYGEDVAFDVYRNGELVNAEPITTKTNYVDTEGKAGDVYTVKKIQDGLTYESEAVVAIDKDYMSIPLQKPDPQPSVTGEMADYNINDAGVADVDGDGQYEIIVKWYPTNSFDSGKAVKPSSPTIFDVYEMDGTALWRLNMGLEMPSGAHFNQFMLYDLDEDGKAELFLKTSDGVVSYKPNAEGKFDMTDESTIVSYIGDKSVVPGTNVNAGGHMSAATNEYVTVFNGLTGEEIDTIDYVNKTGQYIDWGTKGDGSEDDGNRSARYNIAIAYLPKEEGSTETIPAVLFNRGYYAKTTVAAYTLRDGKLEMEWNFVALTGEDAAGKGNHNMSTGDIDNDGFDELVIGALAIDHNGEAIWYKDAEEGRDFSGHADAIHLAAMIPDSNQLYVVVPSEDKSSTLNYSLTNAATGARIAGQFMTKADIGRGMAANITPLAGYEYWANVPNSEIANQAPSGAIYNFYGEVISQEKPVNFTTNWRLFWDGDLLSELPDSYNPSIAEGAMSIFKYNWENNSMDTLVTFDGTKLNNSTKNNPSLTADLFGDWREEVVLRSEDNTELRIYMTSEETDYMIYTLMHDPVYRNAVANQNTAYNQPPQLGFYLGEDIKDTVLAMELPTSKIAYTTQPTVDTTELEAAVNEAKALVEAEYTVATWAVLEEALANAEAVLAKDATAEEVAEALNALKAAVDGLVVKTPEDIARENVTAFVERMYTVALGRDADPSGVGFWVDNLYSYADDGASISKGFILGPEFIGYNYSNSEFIEILYHTYFNRELDEAGEAFWSSALESGASREAVLAGFVNSPEFFNLCRGYGISRGYLYEDGNAVNPGIYRFAERLYSTILERQGDEEGIEAWTVAIAGGGCSPEAAAESFFWSGEYLSKNTSDEDFVKALYRTFMDREADQAGVDAWKELLVNGVDRKTVLQSFAACPEFQQIKAEYGL